MNNHEFYNSFAKDYNLMIPLQDQIESKMKFFKRINNNTFKTAADLGAGSGADSIALANLGLRVTAFEPSDEMIKQAESNFTNHSVNADIYKKRISEIDNSFHESFDIVISLGNTIANIPVEEIKTSLNKIVCLIRPNGKAVIQILNYEKILKERERIVSISESDNKQFIRFYDFVEDKILFNILSFQKHDFSKRQLITTEIFPYTKSFFQKFFKEQNLGKLEFYGDMKLNAYDENSSNNLIVKIEK